MTPVQKRIRIAFALGLLTLVALASLIPWRTPLSKVWGDEGTFLAMAESLVREGDLRFDDRDRLRLESIDAEDRGAATVILQRAPDGTFAYSKPWVYPVVSAPFVAILGRLGPVALNLCLLGLALALAHADLARRSDPGRAALVLVTFVGAGVVLPYTLWRMSDIAQLAFVLAGLTLTLRPHSPPDADAARDRGIARLLTWPGAPYLGSALLGAAIIMRVNNLALAAVPVIAALLGRNLRRATILAAAVALTTGLLFAMSGVLTGAFVPYSAERSSFDQKTGYPTSTASETAVTPSTNAAYPDPRSTAAGATTDGASTDGASTDGASTDGATFDNALATRPATHRTGLIPKAGLDRVVYAVGYFLFGRHTGMLIYFPAALILALAALRRPDTAGTAALIGFAGSAIFFLVWMPFNYFGGNTFIGNRYLLSAYPALLLAPRRLPGGRALAIAWLVSLVAYGSALGSALGIHDRDRSSQNHTRAGLFRALPYESVARDLSGTDRYWGELFVRFVDPLADVGPWWFELSSDRAAAELLVAQWQEPGPLRFRVETDAPEARFVVRDRRRRQVFDVGSKHRKGAAATVDVALARPWRRHRFWWHENQTYNARAFRVGLESPTGEPISARVRLLGVPSLLESAFAYQTRAIDIPDEVAAGETTRVAVEVRNTSGRTWRSQSVTPVFVRQRIRPETTGDGPSENASAGLDIAGPNALLSEVVVPGATTRIEVPVTWPAQPGVYRLDLDLVLGHVGSFGSRLGMPLVDRVVRVTPRRGSVRLEHGLRGEQAQGRAAERGGN